MPAPTAQELRQLASARVAEAESLLAEDLISGAWYVCGYAHELALKACVCKTLQVGVYPDTEVKKAFRTHLIDDLVLLAGLRDRLKVEFRSRPAFERNGLTWRVGLQRIAI